MNYMIDFVSELVWLIVSSKYGDIWISCVLGFCSKYCNIWFSWVLVISSKYCNIWISWVLEIRSKYSDIWISCILGFGSKYRDIWFYIPTYLQTSQPKISFFNLLKSLETSNFPKFINFKICSIESFLLT